MTFSFSFPAVRNQVSSTLPKDNQPQAATWLWPDNHHPNQNIQHTPSFDFFGPSAHRQLDTQLQDELQIPLPPQAPSIPPLNFEDEFDMLIQDVFLMDQLVNSLETSSSARNPFAAASTISK